MSNRSTVIAIAIAAVIGLGIIYFALRRDPSPGDREPEKPLTTQLDGPAKPDEEPQTPADSVRKQGAISDDTRLKPGEVIPGTRPDTLIVQPMQPGPPKEILKTYKVRTPDEDPRIDRRDDGSLVFNEAVALARQLHAANGSPQRDLDLLSGIFGFYRYLFRENPVAEDNAAVIRTLMGRNQHNFVLFPGDHPDLDPDGQLLDRWGTPYFFHALSRKQLDIWSAGPDGKFGSDDDLKLGEDDESLQLNVEIE